jgi:hypothetical protein
LLPEGVAVQQVEVTLVGARRVLSFPSARIPGLRFAFEVPAKALAVTLRGRLDGLSSIERSLDPPGRDHWMVRSNDELRVDLPLWKVAAGWTPYLTLTRAATSPWSLTIVAGEHSKSFSFQGTVQKWDYAPQAWGLVPNALVVRGADPGLSALEVHAVAPEAARPADPVTLLAWPEKTWRNPRREWFHWTGTSVLVLVTSSYDVQDDYLKRLAFYVEKEGFRGRLVSEAEVAHLHGWNAHDYAAEDLARFFNQAVREGFALNREELELRDRLAASGILVAGETEPWKAGTGALVGVSAESEPALRAVLFVHEGFHGLYFTTPEFRAGVHAAWDGLSEAAREAFRTYLSHSRYDPTDEALMVNEFQAYVLQRPAAEWEPFFRDRVLAQESGPKRLTHLQEFVNAARRVDATVQALFGFPSGTLSAVRLSSGT